MPSVVLFVVIFARILYNAHVRAWGISVQYPPCTFKSVKAV
nr:MAG TPA: hypothetical protein [Caudoviricetes sp.]